MCIITWRQREYLFAFQFQKLDWLEHNEVDTEGMIIYQVLSIDPGTTVIESQESCWSEE